MRTQAAWNVETHILAATGPTRVATRCFISSAALLVKVMARIWKGDSRCSLMSQAMRWVSTLVLPEPAPATMSRGPPGWVTASRWTGLSPESRSAGMGDPGYRRGVTAPAMAQAGTGPAGGEVLGASAASQPPGAIMPISRRELLKGA